MCLTHNETVMTQKKLLCLAEEIRFGLQLGLQGDNSEGLFSILKQHFSEL
jgi:hypothetical protein